MNPNMHNKCPKTTNDSLTIYFCKFRVHFLVTLMIFTDNFIKRIFCDIFCFFVSNNIIFEFISLAAS